MTEPRFSVTITFDVSDLEPRDLWDVVPKDPTADDLAEEMEAYMRERRVSLVRLLEDWNLLEDDYVSVYVSGPGFDSEQTTVEVKNR